MSMVTLYVFTLRPLLRPFVKIELIQASHSVLCRQLNGKVKILTELHH